MDMLIVGGIAALLTVVALLVWTVRQAKINDIKNDALRSSREPDQKALANLDKLPDRALLIVVRRAESTWYRLPVGRILLRRPRREQYAKELLHHKDFDLRLLAADVIGTWEAYESLLTRMSAPREVLERLAGIARHGNKSLIDMVRSEPEHAAKVAHAALKDHGKGLLDCALERAGLDRSAKEVALAAFKSADTAQSLVAIGRILGSRKDPLEFMTELSSHLPAYEDGATPIVSGLRPDQCRAIGAQLLRCIGSSGVGAHAVKYMEMLLRLRGDVFEPSFLNELKQLNLRAKEESYVSMEGTHDEATYRGMVGVDTRQLEFMASQELSRRPWKPI